MQEEPVRVNPVRRSEWLKIREEQIRVDAENALRRKEREAALVKVKADGYLENFWRHVAEGGEVDNFFVVRNVEPSVEEAICKKLKANGWEWTILTLNREIRVVA